MEGNDRKGEVYDRSIPARTKGAGSGRHGSGNRAEYAPGFSEEAIKILSELTDKPFIPEKNKFHGLSSRDALVFAHGALKALAANMMKMANDIRWFASGPRCGLGRDYNSGK